MAESAGLREGRIVERFDSFRGTSSKERVKASRHPQGVNFFARK